VKGKKGARKRTNQDALGGEKYRLKRTNTPLYYARAAALERDSNASRGGGPPGSAWFTDVGKWGGLG